MKFKILILAVLFIAASHLSAQNQRYGSLQEALFKGFELSGNSGPESVNWINGGEKFSYLVDGESGSVIRSQTPSSGKDELIFDPAGLTFPGSQDPFSYESFQWSKDSKFILFQSNFEQVWRYSGEADYYYYSIADKNLKLVAEDARTAELSPDGTRVGYEKEGNLFVFELASGEVKQLTWDGKGQLYNGRFGWVYEEEFSIVQGWEWSHDSQSIAYWQSDESQVPIFSMTNYEGHHPEYKEIPYPMVGDTNPTVRIGVVNIDDAKTTWLDLKIGEEYIPRIFWTSVPDQLAVVHLNRKQNHLKLHFFDASNGKGRVIMEERSDAWIDIDNAFFFPESLQEFFWISDRNGWNHIYRYGYDGQVLTQVTEGDWEVEKVHAVDAKKSMVYYTSTEASPLERHLYAISFTGKKKSQLTEVPGRHSIDLSPNTAYYIDDYSNVDLPRQVELWSTRGKMLKKMEDNSAVSEFLNAHVYAKKELSSFTASDGQKLDVYIIKPFDFDENKKYPMVLNIYGGPGYQTVYNQFASNGWEQYLAQNGYVVVSVNNRGGGGYGRDFRKQTYENLGDWEAKDFVETAKYFGSLPWIDGQKMAIRGHSYGGYMASLTTLRYPGVFAAAIVTAPVTDWRLYDTIYTERYMGLLEENEENYKRTSPTTYAENLEGAMLLVHSTSDDNVHVQNTFQLATALLENGKDFEFKIFPKGAHGVAYDGSTYVLLYQQYTDFLNRTLKND